MTFAKVGIHSYIEVLSDMFEDMNRDIFYHRAMTSMMTFVLDGMTADEAYYQYFSPLVEISESKLREIVYAEHLDAKNGFYVIFDLRISVRNSIVSNEGVRE